MEIKEIRDILFNKLFADWQEKLRFFIKSSDFEDVLKFLINEVEEDRRFTPALKSIFRPFQLTFFNEVKVVFLVPTPYQDPSKNSGLCIEVLDQDLPGIPFYRFKAELMREYPEASCDLAEWAKQGVLLLNCALTSEILKLNVNHTKIWTPFMLNVINALNSKSDLIWISIGEESFYKKVNNKHFKFKINSLPILREDEWSSENLFSRINEQLKLENKSTIVW